MKKSLVAVVTGSVIAGLNLVAVPSGASAAAVSPAPIGYSAFGYGTYVSSSLAALQSGPTGYSNVVCTTTPNQTQSNQVASVNLGAIGQVGADTSQSRSIQDASGRTSQSTAQIGGVNLLGGLISASSLKTTTSSTYTLSKTSYGNNMASFVGLKVAGKSFLLGAAPNTRIALTLGGKPLASVVLNEQSQTKVNGLVNATTTAIHVSISGANTLDLPIGTNIYIGTSHAALRATPAGFATGTAYGTKASVGGVLKSGPVSLANVPCDGGDVTASVASSTVPGLVSLGAVKSTTASVTTPTLTSSATNQITGLGVLGSLIKVQAITASTTTSRTSFTAPAVTTDTSKFAGLTVVGLPLINAAVAPNTTINLASLGTVTLHKVTKTALGIRVVMISITLNQALGTLAKGTLVEIGVSETGVQTR